MAENAVKPNTIRDSTEIGFFFIPLTGLFVLHGVLCSIIGEYWDSFIRVYVWLIYNLTGIVNRTVYSIAKKDPNISEFIVALNSLDAILVLTMIIVIFGTFVIYFADYKGEPVIKNSGWIRVILGIYAATTVFILMWMHYFVAYWSKIFVMERDGAAK